MNGIYGNTIPIKTFSSPDLTAAQVEQYLSQMDNEELLDMGFDNLDSYLAAPIMDAKYEKWDIDQVVLECCTHLTPS